MKGHAELYKPGDKVFVSDDIIYMNHYDGVGLTVAMQHMAGKPLTIKAISDAYPKCGLCYTVKENTLLWQDEMLKPVSNIDMTAIDSLLS